MSSNTKMLIDATHPEETRVVVQKNGRVEEFDFESAARKLLRGNIYLAKVTRVEPSLQAAFVDYGGNRHGFLAFNEIHPDYYQIPVADRQALIDEEAAAEAELEAAADRRAEAMARRGQGRRSEPGAAPADTHSDDASEEPGEFAGENDAEPGVSHIIDVEEDEHIEEVGGDADASDVPQSFAAAVERNTDVIAEDFVPRAAMPSEHVRQTPGATDVDAATEPPHMHHEAEDDEDDSDEGDDSDEMDGDAHSEHPESAGEGSGEHSQGSEDQDARGEQSPRGQRRGGRRSEFQDDSRPRRRPRSYKIQEVIKRRQVILVQVVKEERGNKGAALTTYLSLAGRYTVLMPNTARGGGISRKITNPQDRKRLKAIANELEVPDGMGLIIRTAGAARTKQEIKRDFEYLLRLWESVRDLTLQSTAPSLVYEEGDLIKRSIRDLYNKDVEEVVVAGDAGYAEAAAFMHMLMPSHSKHVVPYKNPTPLFTSYGVERQLNAMFLPQVTLRSGGYIVINQTEALVAIDVNSGKSTREFSIEETAIATNLEAADEIARQLKLRDLAGLIVIDFIDMEENRNNRSVERRLKDALRFDRARIQLGRISHFGLMEMSRQRLRTGVLEGSTTQCPHCQGTGIIRSTESIALAVLRGLEDAITAGATTSLIATTMPAVALYILNSKRAYITEMETRHGHTISIVGSDRIQGANFTVERGAPSALPMSRPHRAAVNMDWGFEGEGEEEAPAFQGAEIDTIADPEDNDDGAPVARQGRGEGRSEGRGEGRGENRGEGRSEARGDGEDDGDRNGGRKRRRRGRGRGPREDGDRNANRPHRGPDRSSDAVAGTPRAVGEHAGGDDEIETRDQLGEVRRDQPQRSRQPQGGQSEGGQPEGNRPEGDRPEGDGAEGDRNGRRRRRGRRGGRRGRETGGREGNGAPREHSARDDGTDADPDAGVENSQGVEDKPGAAATVSGYVPQHSMARDSSPPRSNGQTPRQQERSRPERIWDVPVSQPVAQPVAETARPQAPAAVITHDSKPVPIAAADAQPVRRRHEADSSEPRIERVVVRPDEAVTANDEAAAQPQRKGWWQRKFSGE
jgi:ribonuclease E